MRKTPSSQSRKETYNPPAVIHRGALKQFAGSPLGVDPDTNNDLLGLTDLST